MRPTTIRLVLCQCVILRSGLVSCFFKNSPYICSMALTLKKPLKDLTQGELISLNHSLKISCQYFIGKNKKVSVRTYKRSNLKFLGLFDTESDMISIYRGDIPTVGRYVEIFIHEWVHSIQRGLKRNYSKMNKEYGYWNNPYEVEAREGEKFFKSDVWKLTKKLMKK